MNTFYALMLMTLWCCYHMPLAVLLWHKSQAKLQGVMPHTTFLLQKALPKIESGL